MRKEWTHPTLEVLHVSQTLKGWHRPPKDSEGPWEPDIDDVFDS